MKISNMWVMLRVCTQNIDINECAVSVNLPLSVCQQECVNTIGGFRCECMAGFQLNSDNSTCSGVCMCVVSEHMTDDKYFLST